MLASLIAFFQAHSTALSVLAVALLDFAIAIHPGLQSNSIIQLLLSLFKPKAPSA